MVPHSLALYRFCINTHGHSTFAKLRQSWRLSPCAHVAIVLGRKTGLENLKTLKPTQQRTHHLGVVDIAQAREVQASAAAIHRLLRMQAHRVRTAGVAHLCCPLHLRHT